MKIMTHKRIFACLLIFGIAINISFSQTTMTQFRSFIEERCYDYLDGEELIYGQKYPLAHTLENFLNLVEKYEMANPEKSMKDITAMLLRNYTRENLIKTDDFEDGTVSGAVLQNIENYWEKKLPTEQMTENNPFTDDEICSLFFMLSHTINDTAWPFEKQYSRPSPGSNGEVARSVAKTENPREQGVITIKMGNRAVATGRVIAGIYLAFNGDSKDKIADLVKPSLRGNLPASLADAYVNPLYLLTFNDLLALVSWIRNPKKQIAGNGKWDSAQNMRIGTHFNTTGICPNVYRLEEKESSYYTYSSLRGAIDGVILGNMLLENSDFKETKLSQILRMYYSGSGILSSSDNPVSFCRRSELFDKYYEPIKEEIIHSIYILSDAFEDKKITPRKDDTLTNYENFRKNEDVMSADDGSDHAVVCHGPSSTDTVGHLSCDTPSDVIAVLDTQNGIKYLQNQQIILGYLANNLNLWHQGSKLTVLLDKRNETAELVGLEEFLLNSTCSPCAACQLVHQYIDTSNTRNSQDRVEKDFIIQSIDKFLQDIKKEEKDLNGAAGKVVIYFNFDDVETKDYRLSKALSDLYLRHLDTTIFALGKDREMLSKYSRDIKDNVILATEPDLKSVADDLTKRICAKPAALKYEDCASPINEKNAIFEGLITPNTTQFWAMDRKYFEKSYTAKIFIELVDSNGDIDVYHNRAAMTDTDDAEKIRKQLNSSVSKLTYEHMNPCKGFNDVNCPSMLFKLVGRQRNKDIGTMDLNRLCSDKEDSKCKRLDQIRFKISHEGIRCSSCSGLSSTILITIISVIVAFTTSPLQQ